MVLVWFIDEISHHIQEHQSRQNYFNQSFDKVLQRYIEQYVTMFYCVVTTLFERKLDKVERPEHFTLKDMRDLHQTSLLVKESFASGSVDSFLQIELELTKECISLTEKCDFEYYPQFAEIFLEYIQVSLNYNIRDVILDNSRRIRVSDKESKFIHDLLENNAEISVISRLFKKSYNSS